MRLQVKSASATTYNRRHETEEVIGITKSKVHVVVSAFNDTRVQTRATSRGRYKQRLIQAKQVF